MDKSTQTATIGTPLGELELVARGDALVEIRMGPSADGLRTVTEPGRLGPRDPDQVADSDERPRRVADRARRAPIDGVLGATRRQLDDYFAGRSRSFALPVRLDGTAFQRAVWNALRETGYGETTTYGELAARIGRPRAARAVGQALARNPVPIVVPCHRVVGRQGALTGFGGGIERKRLLLELEKNTRG